jgi:class 3 adenylate cyclase/predicted ATPase
MRCEKCGTENPAGKRFCGDCGAPLENRCARCGADNPAEKKFCGDCGAPLAAAARPSTARVSDASPIRVTSEAPAADGERKTVTALFADIKGSTELEQDLDPEEARAIVDPALKLMIDAVRRYDGYIVQSTGDGIFALFGAPVAHEDHPQRALYAALRMQEELHRYSAKLIADGGMPIEARIGANTGEVVVRSISTGGGHVEYTPIGHTTNLASRMQAIAPTGSIAVSPQTRKFVEGYFQLKALGPTRVKGVSEPVDVYEVTGLGPLRTRLQRSAGRGLTKFVGREREMEALKHAAELALAGRGQIAAAMAEAGTGKSRLFFEFKAISQSSWMVLETFSVSHGKASAYLPVIELLWNYFKIASEDDERTRREKVTGRVLALDRHLEDTLPYLFSLLGVVESDDPLAQMDGQIKKRRTLEAIKRILLRESLNQPLMVIFEDLHWIDEETQALLNLLADSIGTARLLLLVNYRPEYTHSWGNKTYYTQLRLDPLGQQSADEMLSALLTSPAPATQSQGASRERSGGDIDVAERVRAHDIEALKRLIIERTGGNPFFMEEMVQVLLDEDALVRDGADVRLTKPLSDLKIPPTVQAILAARIDRLPADEKDLLQALAVLGKEFKLSLVRAVTPKSDDELDRMLDNLQLAEFIYEQPALGDVEYSFKHALTLEVAYNSVLIERRKQLHERAGVALESMFAGQLDDHLDELAHHYSRSENADKAVEYLGRAGRQAMQRSACADAINRLTAAIDRLQKLPDSPQRIQRELLLQLDLGPSLTAAKGIAAPEVERAFSRARELCRREGDIRQIFRVIQGLWAFYLLRGQSKEAQEFATEAFTLAERTKDLGLLTQAHFCLGNDLLWRGEFATSRAQLEQAINLYDSSPQRRSLQIALIDSGVYSWGFLGHVLWYSGYPDQAIKASSRAVALASELNQPYGLAFAQTFLSWLYQYRTESEACRTLTETNLALSSEQGFAMQMAQSNVLRGWAIAQLGEGSDGIALIREGIAAYRATGAELESRHWLSLLAGACAKAGRFEEADRALEEALSQAQKSGAKSCEPELYRQKGDLILARDSKDSHKAEDWYKQALEIARRQGAKSPELRATTSLARLLRDTNRRDKARAMLAGIYNWFTEGFDTADLKDAKALLDELES